MQLNMLIATASLAASVLAPVAAHAHEPFAPSRFVPRPVIAFGYGQPGPQSGRYEWRPVNGWVPARQVQSWVPERCWRGWWGRTQCRPGYSEARWIPAHRETVSERVWVPFRGPPGFARPY